MKHVLVSAFHLASCIALGAISAYWMTQALEASYYSKLWPFILGPVILGLLVIYPFFIEIFVAIYSGALFEIAPMNTRTKAWFIFCLLALLLPALGLIPWVGNQLMLMLVIACIAAIPSTASLFAASQNP